jgi:hypothetical protein
MTTETTYKFADLSDKSKDKVREWFSADVDLEYALDDFKEDMLALDITVEDIQYRGFYSQGDGASWTGSVAIIPFLERLAPDHPLFTKGVVLVELIREGWVDDKASISRASYFYNHSGTMGMDNIGYYIKNADDPATIKGGILQGASVVELFESIGGEYFLEEVGTAILEDAKAHADKLYKDLESAYEWMLSDEHIAECAEFNEWLFDENGKLVD